MAYKTLQNPGLYGMGNDYEQDKTYVVEFVDKDGKPATKETGKSTWRDGIYTKLAYDIKDPEGYNKRTVNTPQSGWNPFTTDEKVLSAISGETDGSALFSPDYATAVSFGNPFSATSAVMTTVFETTETAYYDAPSADKEKIPQGFEVASFRQVNAKKEEA